MRAVFGLAVAALGLALPVDALAQQEDLEAIEVILGYSLVDDVLSEQADAFLGVLEQIAGGGVASPEIEQVVREEFDPTRLRGYVVEELRGTSLPSELTEIADLLRNGAIGQVSDLVVGYEPPESFQVFVITLETSPPPEERVEVLAQLADAQQASGFYLLLDETIREGAHRVLSVLTDGSSPPYAPLELSVEAEQLRRGRQFTIVSYLHRFGRVDDALVQAATMDYRTETGQRYVERYSLSLAEALQLAALRVAGRLDRRP
jgi:hypothetical protein